MSAASSYAVGRCSRTFYEGYGLFYENICTPLAQQSLAKVLT